jgi:hypothetical protein
MKKPATLAAILLASATMAFGQNVTPNLNLATPPFGSANWNIPFNNNFTQLDLFLSGNQPLPALSVTGNLRAPQLTTWNSTTTYSAGNFVVYLGKAYESLSTNTNVLPTNATYWTTSIGSGTLPTIANNTILANNSGGTAQAAGLSASQISTILGLGTAATQATSAFDAAGAASTAQASTEAWSL